MPHKYQPGIYDTHDRLIIIHAVFACLTAFFLVPIALYTARYFRRHPVWYNIHAYLNAFNVCMVCVVFALGERATQPPGHAQQFVGAHSDTHHRFGLATFLLFILQGFFGLLAHYTSTGSPPGTPLQEKDGTVVAPSFFRRGKSVTRYVHVFSGIVMAGCLYGTIYSGFHEWTKSSDNGTPTPLAVRVVFWVLLALEAIGYFAGFLLERRKGRGSAVSSENEKEMVAPQ